MEVYAATEIINAEVGQVSGSGLPGTSPVSSPNDLQKSPAMTSPDSTFQCTFENVRQLSTMLRECIDQVCTESHKSDEMRHNISLLLAPALRQVQAVLQKHATATGLIQVQAEDIQLADHLQRKHQQLAILREMVKERRQIQLRQLVEAVEDAEVVQSLKVKEMMEESGRGVCVRASGDTGEDGERVQKLVEKMGVILEEVGVLEKESEVLVRKVKNVDRVLSLGAKVNDATPTTPQMRPLERAIAKELRLVSLPEDDANGRNTQKEQQTESGTKRKS
eukprot:CAMPEP_0182450272 /NCGR_PEP_ID=MMETSP1172-20130603/40126_1 /TAXON_ID=708627 /ORGANISM="Timspurckia oligopyrenoides, Strain CCMP3278" /LENGTH=277 /DNA_ID=CAMNT_0024647819 /DNA_START=44 /DNA_END=874 /DNA_ORIENTATION=+